MDNLQCHCIANNVSSVGFYLFGLDLFVRSSRSKLTIMQILQIGEAHRTIRCLLPIFKLACDVPLVFTVWKRKYVFYENTSGSQGKRTAMTFVRYHY